MLTDPQLNALIQAGQLVPWVPPPGVVVPAVRHLLLTPLVNVELNRNPWKPVPGETQREATARRRQMLGLLSRYLKGDQLLPKIHAKVLEPTKSAFKDLLEFRSGPPDPQTRLFCYVYVPGIWIGSGFHMRDELGDKGDPRWEVAANQSLAVWNQLFPGRLPTSAPYPCDTRSKLKALLDG